MKQRKAQLHDKQIVSDGIRSLGSDSGSLDHGFAASPRINSFFGNHLVENLLSQVWHWVFHKQAGS